MSFPGQQYVSTPWLINALETGQTQSATNRLQGKKSKRCNLRSMHRSLFQMKFMIEINKAQYIQPSFYTRGIFNYVRRTYMPQVNTFGRLY